MRGPDKQEALFGEFNDGADQPGVLPTSEVTEMDVALLEKKAIGLFLTHHPFEGHPIYSDARYLQLAQLSDSVTQCPSHWQDKVLPSTGLAGLLTNVRVRIANTSGKAYAKARLEDTELSTSVIIWPKAFEDAREIVLENTPVVVWGRIQIPEVTEEGEEAWDGLEIVVDRIMLYEEPEGNTTGRENCGKSGNGKIHRGNGQDSARSHPQIQGENHVHTPFGETHTGDVFSPLPIQWEIDLKQATRDDLTKVADTLERAQGDHEIRMLLREVSGQIKQIKVNQRFYTSLDVAQQLEREFPFITPQY
jgi:DNA polymerase III alpha subunit